MVRIVCRVEFLGVAAVTIGRRPFVTAADMARRAIQRGMHSRQSEAGKLRVIELRSQPGIHRGMAVLARGRETRRLVIGHRILILRSGGRSSSSPTVLGIARPPRSCGRRRIPLRHGRRSAGSGSDAVESATAKPATPHRMTLFATRAKLSAMQIGVAILAAHSHVAEHQAGVALHATHVGVHAAQRIPGFIVIELGDAAEGPPRGEGVAVLARHVEVPVRTSDLCARDRLRLLAHRASAATLQAARKPMVSVSAPSRCLTFWFIMLAHIAIFAIALPWHAEHWTGVGL